MNNHGIDYGMGHSNIDWTNGIRYGVIPMNAVAEWAWDDVEADYGEPTCGHCGNVLVEFDEDRHEDYDEDGRANRTIDGMYVCETCELVIHDEDAYNEEPCGHVLDKDGCKGTVGEDGDLFLLRSPYYTHAQFCSPCAPGACYLLNPTDDDGPRCYALGHDWFEGDVAPYDLYDVATGARVLPVLDTFAQAYVDALLWSETCDPYGTCPDCGTVAVLSRWALAGWHVCAACSEREPHYSPPADAQYTVESLTSAALARILADCRSFQRTNVQLLDALADLGDANLSVSDRAGHDFALTRNGHGAGFWDGDWPEPYASALTLAARSFGECNLYVTDEGRIDLS